MAEESIRTMTSPARDGEAQHCDDIIDDPSWPQCVRDYLRYHRLPASCKCAGMDAGQVAVAKIFIDPQLHQCIETVEPTLFADYDGYRVRVVMASRFGDVGITRHLQAERGYDKRVMVSELSNFSPTLARGWRPKEGES